MPKGRRYSNMRMFRTVKELQEVEVSEVKKQIGAMQSVDVSAYRLSPDVSGGSVESMISTMAGDRLQRDVVAVFGARRLV